MYFRAELGLTEAERRRRDAAESRPEPKTLREHLQRHYEKHQFTYNVGGLVATAIGLVLGILAL